MEKYDEAIAKLNQCLEQKKKALSSMEQINGIWAQIDSLVKITNKALSVPSGVTAMPFFWPDYSFTAVPCRSSCMYPHICFPYSI